MSIEKNLDQWGIPILTKISCNALRDNDGIDEFNAQFEKSNKRFDEYISKLSKCYSERIQKVLDSNLDEEKICNSIITILKYYNASIAAIYGHVIRAQINKNGFLNTDEYGIPPLTNPELENIRKLATKWPSIANEIIKPESKKQGYITSAIDFMSRKTFKHITSVDNYKIPEILSESAKYMLQACGYQLNQYLNQESLESEN